MHTAEKPKPLNPLIIEAINVIVKTKKKFNKLNSRSSNKYIKKYIYHLNTWQMLKPFLIKYISF